MLNGDAMKMRLTGLDFTNSHTLWKLTFRFGDKRSPPAGTYHEEPIQIYDIPLDKSLGKLVFGLNSSQALNSVKFYERETCEHFHEIMGGSSNKKSHEVVIGQHENLVSAKVDTYGK